MVEKLIIGWTALIDPRITCSYSRFIELSIVPSSDIAICISYILIQQRKLRKVVNLAFK